MCTTSFFIPKMRLRNKINDHIRDWHPQLPLLLASTSTIGPITRKHNWCGYIIKLKCHKLAVAMLCYYRNRWASKSNLFLIKLKSKIVKRNPNYACRDCRSMWMSIMQCDAHLNTKTPLKNDGKYIKKWRREGITLKITSSLRKRKYFYGEIRFYIELSVTASREFACCL